MGHVCMGWAGYRLETNGPGRARASKKILERAWAGHGLHSHGPGRARAESLRAGPGTG